MADRFNNARSRRGDWVFFCDICGQKYYGSEAIKLSTYTGRGGLIVCSNDADKIDYGLVPYKIPAQKSIPWARPGTTNVSNGADPIDVETSTQLGT